MDRDLRRPLTALALAAAIAVAAAAPAGARSSETSRAHAASLYTVRLKDSYFSPASIKARGKATLRFVWAGKLAHNLIGRRIPSSYASARVRHATLTRSYGRGIYTFRCTIHPGMSLKLRVR